MFDACEHSAYFVCFLQREAAKKQTEPRKEGRKLVTDLRYSMDVRLFERWILACLNQYDTFCTNQNMTILKISRKQKERKHTTHTHTHYRMLVFSKFIVSRNATHACAFRNEACEVGQRRDRWQG